MKLDLGNTVGEVIDKVTSRLGLSSDDQGLFYPKARCWMDIDKTLEEYQIQDRDEVELGVLPAALRQKRQLEQDLHYYETTPPPLPDVSSANGDGSNSLHSECMNSQAAAESKPSSTSTAGNTAESYTTAPVETWSVHDVVAWLQDIKLTDLVETMKENLICGVDLLELTDTDLKQEL